MSVDSPQGVDVHPPVSMVVRDGIATITLDRPEALNAFTVTMFDGLHALLDRVDADDAIRAVVITGRGKAFSAGVDLSPGPDTFHPSNRRMRGGGFRDPGGELTLRLYALNKPLIAAVNGVAVGIGATMTLPADVRIMADSARFGFVFSRRGIIPEACSTWFLPRIVGIGVAAEWCYSGRTVDAVEAREAGLVSRVVPADELAERAHAVAVELTEKSSSISVALSRQLLWRMLGAEHPEQAHRIESDLLHWLGRQPDAAEGVASFLEKRPPRFPMSVSKDLPAPWWKD
jgi:enoyl-CoA hydratase/carnithine racemase